MNEKREIEKVEFAELRFCDGTNRTEKLKKDPTPRAVIFAQGKRRVFHYVGVQKGKAIYIEEAPEPPEPVIVG